MARTKHLNPAEAVIYFLGMRPLAAGIQVAPSTIARWRQRPGGVIPGDHHGAILDYARSERVRYITADALVYGVDVPA